MTESWPLPVTTRVLAGILGVSGLAHLVRPEVYEPLMPAALPAHRIIIYGSGVAEIACAAGLVTRARWAPAATAGLLVAVWPGNVTMAVRWQRSERRTRMQKAVAWARLPLQVPMVVAALRSPTR